MASGVLNVAGRANHLDHFHSVRTLEASHLTSHSRNHIVWSWSTITIASTSGSSCSFSSNCRSFAPPYRGRNCALFPVPCASSHGKHSGSCVNTQNAEPRRSPWVRGRKLLDFLSIDCLSGYETPTQQYLGGFLGDGIEFFFSVKRVRHARLG